MSDNASNASPEQDSAPPPVPPWTRATAQDIAAVDFEAPLNGATSADCNELSRLYRTAVTPSDGSAPPPDSPGIRVFEMLSSVTGMHFKPEDRNEPFGPMWVFADGRSAVPSDFRWHVDLLADMAERAGHPILRARLSDVCWLLDRKRGKLALAAVVAYTEIVQKIEDGGLKHHFATDGAALHDSRDYLLRGLQIGRAVGWEKPETIAARDLVKRLREQALTTGALVSIQLFSDLDLGLGVSDPAQVGGSLDSILTTMPAGWDSHSIVDLWRLAARAYQFANMEDDKNRCLAGAAEALVAKAESLRDSAMLASHFLSAAIAQLHGLPGKKDRRTALRHKLIDCQSRVPEEMTVFSQELDLREIAQRAQKAVGGGSLLDKLFIFAALSISPDPEKLASDAAKAIERNPLSSIMGSWHLDRDGKVIHRTQGGGFGDGADDPAVHQRVAQGELIRRKLVASGQIEAARHAILEQHFISDDAFVALLNTAPSFRPTSSAPLHGATRASFRETWSARFTSSRHCWKIPCDM
jgi:hypothetical protein